MRTLVPVETRLWSKVDKDGPVVRPELGPCWLWTGATKDNGYGTIGLGRHGAGHAYVHRLSHEMHLGPIPPGTQVCHRCDVRNCVRPSHLFLGTSQANQDDMVAKQRSTFGERHPRHVLTEGQVVELRRLWGTGQWTAQELAELFGTNKGNVSQIVRGKRWRHLLPPDWTTPPRGRWSNRC